MQWLRGIEHRYCQSQERPSSSSHWVSEGVRRKVTSFAHSTSIGVAVAGWLAIAYAMTEVVIVPLSGFVLAPFIIVAGIQATIGATLAWVGSFAGRKIKPLLINPTPTCEKVERFYLIAYFINFVSSIVLGIAFLKSGHEGFGSFTGFTILSNFTLGMIATVLFPPPDYKNTDQDCFCVSCVVNEEERRRIIRQHLS